MEKIFVGQSGLIEDGVRKAYRLRFPDFRGHAAKTVQFDSDDGHEAFVFAQRENHGRSVELWLDDERICDLKRDEDDVWSIHRAKTD